MTSAESFKVSYPKHYKRSSIVDRVRAMSYYPPDRLVPVNELGSFYTSGPTSYVRSDDLDGGNFYRGYRYGSGTERGGPGSDLSTVMGVDEAAYHAYSYPQEEAVRSPTGHVTLQSSYYPHSDEYKGALCPPPFHSIGSGGYGAQGVVDYPAPRRSSNSPLTCNKKSTPVFYHRNSTHLEDLHGSESTTTYPGAMGSTPQRHYPSGIPSGGDRPQELNQVDGPRAAAEGYAHLRRYEARLRIAAEDLDDKGVEEEAEHTNNSLGGRFPPAAAAASEARNPRYHDDDPIAADSSMTSQKGTRCPSSSAGGGDGIVIGSSSRGPISKGGSTNTGNAVKLEEGGGGGGGEGGGCFVPMITCPRGDVDGVESTASESNDAGSGREEDGTGNDGNDEGAPPMFPWMRLHHGKSNTSMTSGEAPPIDHSLLYTDLDSRI